MDEKFYPLLSNAKVYKVYGIFGLFQTDQGYMCGLCER